MIKLCNIINMINKIDKSYNNKKTRICKFYLEYDNIKKLDNISKYCNVSKSLLLNLIINNIK